MASKDRFKSKAYGSDVHEHIKAKIYARQQSNLGVEFGEAITGARERYNLSEGDIPLPAAGVASDLIQTIGGLAKEVLRQNIRN